jgi:type IV secretory pathway VirB2 component (pilin)
MALSLVIARFGLFLHLVSAQSPAMSGHRERGASAWLRVVFVVVGATAILTATMQHRRYIRSLPKNNLPGPYYGGFALLLSAIVGVLGLLLAVHFTLSQV